MVDSFATVKNVRIMRTEKSKPVAFEEFSAADFSDGGDENSLQIHEFKFQPVVLRAHHPLPTTLDTPFSSFLLSCSPNLYILRCHVLHPHHQRSRGI